MEFTNYNLILFKNIIKNKYNNNLLYEILIIF